MLEWCPFTESFLNVQFKCTDELFPFLAYPFCCFLCTLWQLNFMMTFKTSASYGQQQWPGLRAMTAAGQAFSPCARFATPELACETLPCWVPPHAVFQLKTPNNLSSVLVLSISPNSWQLLKRANDLATESWDFESWSQPQLQVPPPAPTGLQARAPPQLPHHGQRGHRNASFSSQACLQAPQDFVTASDTFKVVPLASSRLLSTALNKNACQSE